MWKERKYSSGFGLLQAEPPQLQVTEAYYRMCASAAGEEGGQMGRPWAVGTVPSSRPGSASLLWGGMAGLGCPKVLSRNSDGQKTPAKLRGGEEGRSRGAERDLGRTVLKTLLLDMAGSFQRKPLGWLGCGQSSFLSPECRGQNPWKPVESARKEFDSNQISLIKKKEALGLNLRVLGIT